MDKLKELYTKKGEAHTQVEIWQQVLKQVNQELSQELNKNPGGANVGVKKDTGDTKKSETSSNREGSKPVYPK